MHTVTFVAQTKTLAELGLWLSTLPGFVVNVSITRRKLDYLADVVVEVSELKQVG